MRNFVERVNVSRGDDSSSSKKTGELVFKKTTCDEIIHAMRDVNESLDHEFAVISTIPCVDTVTRIKLTQCLQGGILMVKNLHKNML